MVLALHHPELVDRLVVVDISRTRESFPDFLAWMLCDAFYDARTAPGPRPCPDGAIPEPGRQCGREAGR